MYLRHRVAVPAGYAQLNVVVIVTVALSPLLHLPLGRVAVVAAVGVSATEPGLGTAATLLVVAVKVEVRVAPAPVVEAPQVGLAWPKVNVVAFSFGSVDAVTVGGTGMIVNAAKAGVDKMSDVPAMVAEPPASFFNAFRRSIGTAFERTLWELHE